MNHFEHAGGRCSLERGRRAGKFCLNAFSKTSELHDGRMGTSWREVRRVEALKCRGCESEPRRLPRLRAAQLLVRSARHCICRWQLSLRQRRRHQARMTVVNPVSVYRMHLVFWSSKQLLKSCWGTKQVGGPGRKMYNSSPNQNEQPTNNLVNSPCPKSIASAQYGANNDATTTASFSEQWRTGDAWEVKDTLTTFRQHEEPSILIPRNQRATLTGEIRGLLPVCVSLLRSILPLHRLVHIGISAVRDSTYCPTSCTYIQDDDSNRPHPSCRPQR